MLALSEAKEKNKQKKEQTPLRKERLKFCICKTATNTFINHPKLCVVWERPMVQAYIVKEHEYATK